MIAIVLKAADDRQMGALLFQKSKDFKVYLPQGDRLSADYENRITVANGRLQDVTEPLVCLLEPGVIPDKGFVRRILRAARRHPDFNVYHINAPQGKAWPRKFGVEKLFRQYMLEGLEVTLSSLVFRTAVLREKAVFNADSSLDVPATLFSCAGKKPVRNVWHQTLDVPRVPAADAAGEEGRIRQQLEFYRWSELFFEEYPLSTGERLSLVAASLAKLYPEHPVKELKELFYGFQVAQGPIRKMRASSALKSALKEREKLSEVQ